MLVSVYSFASWNLITCSFSSMSASSEVLVVLVISRFSMCESRGPSRDEDKGHGDETHAVRLQYARAKSGASLANC